MRDRGWVPAALCVILLGGCSRVDNRRVEVRRDTVGDTVFVTVRADTAPTHSAEEDLRLGRFSAGPEEVQFGRVQTLHVDRAGRWLIYDALRQAVVRLTPDGVHLDEIGGAGQGPGEYQHIWGIATDRQGRIFLATSDARVLVYDEGGAYLDEWRTPRRIWPSNSISADEDGAVTVTARPATDDNARGYRFRLYRFTASGELVDSITPHIPWEDEWQVGRGRPVGVVAWGPAGFGVTAVTNRLGFEVFRPGRDTVYRVEQDATPIPFSREERRENLEYSRFLIQRSRNPDAWPPPPEYKPLARGAVISETGEVWLVRTRPARRNPNAVDSIMGLPAAPDWIQPFRAEVYSERGEYLATVSGPEGFRLLFARSDTLWGVQEGRAGEDNAVRLRVKPPAEFGGFH